MPDRDIPPDFEGSHAVVACSRQDGSARECVVLRAPGPKAALDHLRAIVEGNGYRIDCVIQGLSEVGAERIHAAFARLRRTNRETLLVALRRE